MAKYPHGMRSNLSEKYLSVRGDDYRTDLLEQVVGRKETGYFSATIIPWPQV
jgi:hypothetical protein